MSAHVDTASEARLLAQRLPAKTVKISGSYRIVNDTLLELASEIDCLRDENERLRKAMRNIARQKRTDELETEYDVEVTDFEGGYDEIINVARAALNGEGEA